MAPKVVECIRTVTISQVSHYLVPFLNNLFSFDSASILDDDDDVLILHLNINYVSN